MFYTIYRITCKINGKVYIGKHQTKKLNDKYFGSGKLLRAAISKYGQHNFEKEILFTFDTEEEMNQKEAELVTEDFCRREDNYNLCPGGHGGFGYINNQLTEDLKHIRQNAAKKIPLEARQRAGRKSGKDNILKAHRDGKVNPITFLGRNHTEETKAKMRDSQRGNHIGAKNSQFGSMWITNGVESQKVSKDSLIPNGWRRGRK